MQLKNAAAWIPSAKAPLSVGKAPFPACSSDELIISTSAVAVNPVDWKIQSNDGFGLTYPAILGEDVVGTVIEVGKDLQKAKKFQVGDRVIAHTLGLANGPAYGGFQLYPVLKAATVARIPDKVADDEAVVLPLSVSTAAAGLYMKACLGLEYPEVGEDDDKDAKHRRRRQRQRQQEQHQEEQQQQEEKEKKEKKKPWLLLWGGSSSVGSSVIQLAKASGYAVATTASPANYGYCYKLGAQFVLDYHNPVIVEILAGLLKDKEVVGAYDAIGDEATVKQCADVLAKVGGGRVASVGSAPDGLPKGTEVVRISSGNIVSQEPEVAEKIWGEFVPEALAKGDFVPAPEPLVVGTGLESVQKGLDTQKKGVSAKKVVVTLADE